MNPSFLKLCLVFHHSDSNPKTPGHPHSETWDTSHFPAACSECPAILAQLMAVVRLQLASPILC